MDDWDNLLFNKNPKGIKGVKNVNIPQDITEDTTSDIPENITEELLPKLPKEILKKSVPKVADLAPFLPQLEKKKTPKLAALSGQVVSPYVSKIPAIWSADWANKFATLALALTITFGVYSYSGYIANFGLRQVALVTADSLINRAEKLRDTLALTVELGDEVNQSQLAAPAAVIFKF